MDKVQTMDAKQIASWVERRVPIKSFNYEAAFQGKF